MVPRARGRHLPPAAAVGAAVLAVVPLPADPATVDWCALARRIVLCLRAAPTPQAIAAGSGGGRHVVQSRRTYRQLFEISISYRSRRDGARRDAEMADRARRK